MNNRLIMPPSEGDTVMFCGHADVSEFHIDISRKACATQPFHWYWFEDPEGSKAIAHREDGEEIRFHWVAVCADCHARFKDVFDAVKQDAPWIGAPPEIIHAC